MAVIAQNKLHGMFTWGQVQLHLGLSTAKVDVIVVVGNRELKLFVAKLPFSKGRTVQKQMVVPRVFHLDFGGGDTHAAQAKVDGHRALNGHPVLKTDKIKLCPVRSFGALRHSRDSKAKADKSGGR